MKKNRNLNKKFTALWAVWISMFIAIEAYALFNMEQNDTLSDHVWAFAAAPIGWLVVGGFMVWLTKHFLFDGAHWRKPPRDEEDEL